MGHSFEGDVEFRDQEALAFYLRALVTFHRVRNEMKGTGEVLQRGGKGGVDDGGEELKR